MNKKTDQESIADVAGAIDESFRSVFISPNVGDSNMEPANVVDVIHDLARAVYCLRSAVTSPVAGGRDAMDGHVECLTEAVMGITSGLAKIADAIGGLAEAVRETKDS